MSGTGSNLLVDVPVELACEVLRGWLDLKNIVRLDTAFCSTVQRNSLATIFSSSLFSLIDVPWLNCSSRSMEWIAARNIRVETLRLHGDSDVSCQEHYLRKFGTCVKTIYLRGFDDSRRNRLKMSLIVQHCSNLRSVLCSSCSLTSQLIELLSTNLKLNSITFEQVGGLDYELIPAEIMNTPATHHLPLQAIDIDGDEIAEACIFNLCAPERVQRMSVPASIYLPEWPKFVNLRCLQFSGESLPDDETLLHIATHCPGITDLNISISNTEDLTDVGIEASIAALQQLRSINVERLGLEDYTLQNVVERHKHSLQAMYMYACGITTAGLNHALSVCTQLRTVSYTTRKGVDYTLLDRVTTLVTDLHCDAEGWQALQQHCARLQHVYFTIGSHQLADGRVARMAQTMCELPALRTVTLVCPSLRGKSLLSVLDAQLAELRHQRPFVRIIEAKYGAWYDLFSLSHHEV